MGLPTSLVRRHNHMNALAALGVAPEKPTFPATVGCPLCHTETLYLFDDLETDGIWLHCETCRAHGDIITFGAQIWNTSLAAALTKFAEIGAIARNEGEYYAGEYSRSLNKLTAAGGFWEEVQGQVWNHGDDIIACRVRELGVEKELSGCRGLIGVAHYDQVLSVCSEIGRAAPARTRENGPSLVLPFYDLPSRLTGFLMVQYTKDFEPRRNFIPLTGYKRKKPNAGYYLLHTATLAVPKTMRDSYFVVDDPFWALKAQTTQIKAGAGLLPIAASYYGSDGVSEGYSWTAFPNTPRFFQGSACTPELVSRACAARGYVCVAPGAALESATTPFKTMHKLAHIRRTAQTWQQALEAFFSASNELMAQSFAAKLTIPYDKLQTFFKTHEQKFSAEFAGRVLTQVTAPPVAPTRFYKNSTVMARDGGWWTHKGANICNAQIKITRVIYVRDGAKFYSGLITTANNELPFIDSAKKIEKMGLLAYAAQHAAVKGIFIRYDQAWNARSHLISMTLNEPELITVADTLGWDEQTNQFCFYSYSLSNDGSVVTNPVTEIRETRRADFPTPDVAAPLSLWRTLTVSDDNAFAWAVFGAIAAQLIAPAAGKPAPIVALSDATFEAAAKIGAALDCALVTIQNRSPRHVMNNIVRTVGNETWPIFMSHSFNSSFCSCAVPRCIAGPGFVKLPGSTAAAAPSYGWHQLCLAPPAQELDAATFRYVLPAYIQALLRDRLSVFTTQESPLLAVLTHLADWLEKTYGRSFNLALASNKVLPPSRAHEAMMAEITRAAVGGHIDLLPRPRRSNQPKNYLLRNKKHWWLNQYAIDSYFYSTGKLAPNWLAIQELFETQHLLCGTDNVYKMSGLLVRSEWCEQFLRDFEAKQLKGLG